MFESQEEKGTDGAPRLSVVLVAGSQRGRAGRALHSLLAQTAIDQMEILLYDLGDEGLPPLPGSDHRRVKSTRWGPNDLLAAARFHGVQEARAPVVCFMEEHCEMQPGWAEAILLAHREPWAAVGSDFINANPEAGCSNNAFRMNYGIYVRPPSPRGPVRMVAGQNSAFKRDVLLRYNSQLELMLSADLVLQWKMQQDGYKVFYEPSVKLAHRNETSFKSLATGVFYWNWCFSNIRARIFEWGTLRRVAWVALSPLIPWVRICRLGVQLLSRGHLSMSQFFRDVPFIIGISYCAAAGQVAGLVNGSDRAVRKFSHFEMNEPRLLQSELAR